MAKTAIYRGEREVRTFADLFHASLVMLKKAEEDERGSNYTNMASLLFAAFTFEAYLNHLGALQIEYWPEIESIKVMDKYSCLCKDLGIKSSKSKRPYQTLSKLFRFRNSLAHGKTQILKKEVKVDPSTDPWKHTPKTDWEEFCTHENAVRVRDDIAAIVGELHKAAGLGDHPFMHGATMSSVSIR